MGDNKSSHQKTYPFDLLERLRETPQLLPHESLKEFHELFASFEDYGKPQNLPRPFGGASGHGADLGHPALPGHEGRGVAQPPAAGIGVPAPQN